jgi:hypothetical protein
MVSTKMLTTGCSQGNFCLIYYSHFFTGPFFYPVHFLSWSIFYPGPFYRAAFGEPLFESDTTHGWVEALAWSPSGTVLAYAGIFFLYIVCYLWRQSDYPNRHPHRTRCISDFRDVYSCGPTTSCTGHSLCFRRQCASFFLVFVCGFVILLFCVSEM